MSSRAGLGGTGESYVVFGKDTGEAIDLSDIASGEGGFVIRGESAGDKSGWSVSGAGDVNGDGYDDLAVGDVKGDRLPGDVRELDLAKGQRAGAKVQRIKGDDCELDVTRDRARLGHAQQRRGKVNRIRDNARHGNFVLVRIVCKGCTGLDTDTTDDGVAKGHGELCTVKVCDFAGPHFDDGLSSRVGILRRWFDIDDRALGCHEAG